MPQSAHPWIRWPRGAGGSAEVGLAYGGDYNPEQWPRQTWVEDARLMREAGVNLVNVAVFSWTRLQPTHDSWDFDWLDEVMDLLHSHGIAVDLATATASPPPWLTRRHPEVLPVDRAGVTISPGGRQHWRPTSPVFRRHALSLVEAMADRYGDHPALAMWHISNELGDHNRYDYSEDAAGAFRDWLGARYGEIGALNEAWGTAFWSQRYADFSEILPPRQTVAHPNPTQQLDFARFSSDALRDYLRAERAVLRARTPDIPTTTNFMIMNEGSKGMDYASWADDVDIVSNDHYVLAARPDQHRELSFSANLTRGVARGRPWFLMEHSTSAVNWQPVNVPKPPGRMRRDSLTHVAHGADAVSFFQWRQSKAGSEKYHSAMLPHGGTDTRIWRNVVALGQDLRRLEAVRGTTVRRAQVALLFDWESWWGLELDSHPTDRLRYRAGLLDWYVALVSSGFTVDVLPAAHDFSEYELLVAPLLYIVGTERRRRLFEYVGAGGHLVTTFFSGIVDEHDHVHLGGYPGALRDLLGVRVEEFGPMLAGQTVTTTGPGVVRDWAEAVDITDPAVDVLLRYLDGPHCGQAVATSRAHGDGRASYLGASLDRDGLTSLVAALGRLSGLTPAMPPALAATGLEVVVREDEGSEFAFFLNHGDCAIEASCRPGLNLLRGEPVGPTLRLGPGEVAVVQSAR